MAGFLSRFGGGGDGERFDEYDEFVPDHVPEPGTFLQGHVVLSEEDHVAFHRATREIFEVRGVYDVTFGYNLARLNLDSRHPDSGFRYAVDADDPSVLRAEFTPTTPFCPQSDTLTRGAFRAWNGLSERHEFDLVRVRVDEMHHHSEAVNETLRDLAEQYRETGTVPNGTGTGQDADGPGAGSGDRPDGRATASRSDDAPF